MGSFLDKPKTEKTNDHGQGNELRYGLGAMQGWRIEMEDSHSAFVGLPRGLDNWSFFAVFDGHAGGTVSKCSSKELLNSILEADVDLFNDLATIYNQNSRLGTSLNTTTNSSSSNTTNSISSSSSVSLNNCSPTKTTTSTTDSSSQNHDTAEEKSDSNNKQQPENTTTNSDSNSSNKNNEDTNLNNVNNNNNNNNNNSSSSSTNLLKNNKFTAEHEERLRRAIRAGFLNLDEKLRQMPEFDKGEDKSGSTAVACLITPSHVYLINCGDSRAILVSGNKVALGTYDHKPINPNERERIQNAGGSVMIQRVNGSLAVSRALGDYEYKCVEGRGPCEQLVSPEPEIYAHERTDKDEFVVLACDGIWDVMSNDELKDYVHSRLRITNDLVKISNDILDLCLNKGSRDNMSLIIVSFPGAPKVDQGEIDKEISVNERIESKVKELIESSNTRIEISQILNLLSEENWDDLPPGGGLHAKQAFIEEIYNRLSPKSNEDDNIHNAYIVNPPL